MIGMDDSPGWLRVSAAAIIAVTLWRILGLALAQTDLFVDEAQYWLWSQTPDWGYFSKPPMIAWVIHASTWLGGSDAPFWVRLPAPIFHAATAFLLLALARGPFGNAAAGWAGLAYITLPGVAAGSAVISTDTIMLPFLAAAILGWSMQTSGRSWAWAWALFTGAALGLAFLSKYAALYFWLGAILSIVMLDPPPWPGWRSFMLMLLTFLAVIFPNLMWNWQNSGETLLHTLSNTGWVTDSGPSRFNPINMLEFLGAQFAIFGPLLFAALIWATVRGLRGRALRPENLMLLFSVPIIVLVAGQALVSRAYANWAVAACLGGTIAAVALLRMQARWVLWLSLLLNGAVAIATPVALTWAHDVELRDRLVFARLLGRAEVSEALLDAAEASNASTIVASNRDLLADLFYTGQDRGIAIRALRGDGLPKDHYEAVYPYQGGARIVLWVLEGNSRPSCAARGVIVLKPQEGAFAGKTFTGWVVAGSCRGLLP